MKESEVFTAGSRILIQFDTIDSEGKEHSAEQFGAAVHFERNRLTAKVYHPPQPVEIGTKLTFIEVKLFGFVTYTGHGVVEQVVKGESHYHYGIELGVPWSTESHAIAWDKIETGFNSWNRRMEMIDRLYRDIVHELEFRLVEFKLQAEQKVVSRMARGGTIEEATLSVATDEYQRFTDALIGPFMRFEKIARTVNYGEIARRFFPEATGEALAQKTQEVEQVHADYSRRVLHPRILGSPFVWRVFFKPLGQPGDFEMVNMILGKERMLGDDPLGMCMNKLFLDSPVAQGHRNRIDIAVERIGQEARRVLKTEEVVRILDVGSGPAEYPRRLLKDPEIGNRLEFTFLDSSKEAMAFVKAELDKMRKEVDFIEPNFMVKNAVMLALRQVRRGNLVTPKFHIVTCFGMFDYLTYLMAQAELTLFDAWTLPGGLEVWSNVTPENPIQKIMEHPGDWNLEHRGIPEMETLGAPNGELDHVVDDTKTNAIQFIRKSG